MDTTTAISAILTLLAGIGIFLIACQMMSSNLESASSKKLRRHLRHDHRFRERRHNIPLTGSHHNLRSKHRNYRNCADCSPRYVRKQRTFHHRHFLRIRRNRRIHLSFCQDKQMEKHRWNTNRIRYALRGTLAYESFHGGFCRT